MIFTQKIETVSEKCFGNSKFERNYAHYVWKIMLPVF